MEKSIVAGELLRTRALRACVSDIVFPMTQPSIPPQMSDLGHKNWTAEPPVLPPALQVTLALRNNRQPTQVTMPFTRILLM